MSAARDLKHPPIESAYGVRIGDVVRSCGVRGVIAEMRTGYATGTGVRALIMWDHADIARSTYPSASTHSLKDPSNIPTEAILKWASGPRVFGAPTPKRRVTTAELIASLKALASNPGDKESDHQQADGLLLDYIAQFPDGEAVRDAFNAIDKWYA